MTVVIDYAEGQYNSEPINQPSCIYHDEDLCDVTSGKYAIQRRQCKVKDFNMLP